MVYINILNPPVVLYSVDVNVLVNKSLEPTDRTL